jgi:membrane protein DedA with SNARE-associated domain
MVETILTALSHFVINTIFSMGYLGVVLLMGIESANIPLPSEVIMPFSGYLVYTGKFNLFWVAIAGGLGCLWGSLFSYWIGAKGGRPLIEKYGKYILMSKHDLDIADKWFMKWGMKAVFVGRLLPVIRTFISFPAGIARVNLFWFSVWTFIGSVIWSYFLGWVGYKMGENWDTLGGYFHKFDTVIGIFILVGLAWYIWRHIKHSRAS